MADKILYNMPVSDKNVLAPAPVTIKHLIGCRCILPQFKRSLEPIFHKFIVFSILENDNIVSKLVQCNNCDIVHRIVDFCKSEIVEGKESAGSILSINDMRSMLPHNFSGLLDTYDAPLYVWEEIHHALQNSLWNSKILLWAEDIDGERHGKWLVVKNESSFTIEPFTESFCLL